MLKILSVPTAVSTLLMSSVAYAQYDTSYQLDAYAQSSWSIFDHPDIDFIAIDFYNKGCWKTCRRIDREGLTNVRVARYEARAFIAERIPKGLLTAVYINCPDPWPKKKHRKRRLVNWQFMEFLSGYLAPGADFWFATDFDDYGADVAGMMTSLAGYVNMLAPDLYRHELEGYHLSKYMRKFMAEGKRIYFVHYRKL